MSAAGFAWPGARRWITRPSMQVDLERTTFKCPADSWFCQLLLGLPLLSGHPRRGHISDHSKVGQAPLPVSPHCFCDSLADKVCSGSSLATNRHRTLTIHSPTAAQKEGSHAELTRKDAGLPICSIPKAHQAGPGGNATPQLRSLTGTRAAPPSSSAHSTPSSSTGSEQNKRTSNRACSTALPLLI